MLHIAIFGGTFDPIHYGHLKTSLAIQSYFKFERYIFLPCKQPTIKPSTFASNAQRIKMIELAIQEHQEFKLDRREIERASPSYMIETLESFRLEYPDASITLIIGYDAFISLPQWHQWEQLITLANIIVINRNEFEGQKIPAVLKDFLHNYQSKKRNTILNKKAGTVFLFDAGYYKISSTEIRNRLKQKQDVLQLLPHSVYEYIKTQKELYQ